MGYVDRVLQPSEQVVYRGELHWIAGVPAIVFLALALTSIAIAFTSPDNDAVLGAAIFSGFFLIGSILLVTSTLIRFYTTEIAITNRRVIFKQGLIRRHTAEMNLGKVESVDVDQSVLGRLLDFGTVTIHGTGSGMNAMRQIEAPLALRSFITAN